MNKQCSKKWAIKLILKPHGWKTRATKCQLSTLAYAKRRHNGLSFTFRHKLEQDKRWLDEACEYCLGIDLVSFSVSLIPFQQSAHSDSDETG